MAVVRGEGRGRGHGWTRDWCEENSNDSQNANIPRGRPASACRGRRPLGRGETR